MSIRFFGIFVHMPLIVVAVAEGLVLWLAAVTAAALYGAGLRDGLPDPVWQFALLFVACCIVTMAGLGLFSRRQRANTAGLLVRIAAGVVLGGAGAVLVARVTGVGEMWLPVVGYAMLVGVVLAGLMRVLLSKVINEDVFRRRVLIYGAGTRAESVSNLRRRADQRGFKIMGFVAAQDEASAVPGDRLLHSDKSLVALANELEVDEIVVAMDDRRRNFPVAELLECRLAGIDVVEVISFLERETGKVRLDVLHPSWLIFSSGFRRDPLREATRRSFDFLASVVLLIVASPFILLTTLAIKLEDGLWAPVLYRQTRVGLLGRTFEIMKFRSMRIDAEKDGQAQWATENDDRVTRLGRFIRKTRIDELPQIFNVLRGDMSFVGPRPERPQFVDQLSERIPYYRERHWVKPGITGWAQLCYAYGASEADAAEKLQFDLFYVKNHGLLFDLMILLQTAEVILLGKGAR
jgi:sugar transferase (PEP-CTERM system associated)